MKFGLRELTFFLLLAAIPVTTVMLVFRPAGQRMEQARRENEEKTARLTQLDQIGRTGEQLGREVEELGKALEYFESKLPAQQQIHAVLAEVTGITEQCKLTTKSVRTLKQNETADYVDQPIEIEMSGRFESFYRFMLDLERLPRITRVSLMDLKKDEVEGRVQAKLVLSIYFESPAAVRLPAGSGAT